MPNSGDEHLLWMEEKLHKVHKEFYARVDAGAKADVRVCCLCNHNEYQEHHKHQHKQEVIRDLRSHLLEGAVLAFSRVYPHGSNLEREYVWQSARWCGASCRSTLSPDVTHLVTTNDTTNKALSALKNPKVRVVHLDWFVDVTQKWNRDEGTTTKDEHDEQPPAKRARVDKESETAPPRPEETTEAKDEDEEEEFLRMCDEVAEEDDEEETHGERDEKDEEKERKSHD